MRTHSLREFVQAHKEELDRYILRHVPNVRQPLTANERRLWVLNDEFLYLWAKREGVKL